MKDLLTESKRSGARRCTTASCGPSTATTAARRAFANIRWPSMTQRHRVTEKTNSQTFTSPRLRVSGALLLTHRRQTERHGRRSFLDLNRSELHSRAEVFSLCSPPRSRLPPRTQKFCAPRNAQPPGHFLSLFFSASQRLCGEHAAKTSSAARTGTAARRSRPAPGSSPR